MIYNKLLCRTAHCHLTTNTINKTAQMYNGKLHIYCIQHTDDAIYTTLNINGGLFTVSPYNSKIRSTRKPACLPKLRQRHCCWHVSSRYRYPEVSHVLLHVDSTWSERGCEIFYEYWFAVVFTGDSCHAQGTGQQDLFTKKVAILKTITGLWGSSV